ncbi:MAG: DUF2157 domain-containing protein [Lentisphaerae bacterium]|nr:DUF2157 domain-containing protein [Lentisphaerota bacterium]
MAKPWRWLEQELPEWVKDGLVSVSQAGAIRARYAEKESGGTWGTALFSGIGGVIIGLGVILLFAYNWQAVPKFWKMAIILGGLALTHAVGIQLFLRSDRFRGLGEAIGLMGTMFFGAGIWLVAQIYNIDEHFPNAFLIWSAGALLMAWALPSVLQAVLAAILIAVWCGAESIAFDTSMTAGPLLVTAGLLPLAYTRRSRLLLLTIILSFGVSLVCVLGAARHGSDLIFSALLSVAGLLIAGGALMRQERRFPESAPLLATLGWIFFFIALYILTFPDATRELLRIRRTEIPAGASIWWGATVGLCLAAWLALGIQKFARGRADLPFHALLIPLTVLLTLIYSFAGGGHYHWEAAAPFNLVFLALTVTFMARGCRDGRLAPTVTGSLLLLALMLSRYFDLLENLLARGAVFILVGGLIFAQGILYTRARKRATEAAPS